MAAGDVEAEAEADDIYTKDGTVDYRGNPANRRKTGTWRACPFILGNECCERLAYYGMSTNIYLYFKNQLNQHTATASRNVSNWSGTCYIMPLLGAFLADSYLGRYWTIASFSIIYVLGMTLLTISASVPGARPTCSKTDKNVCTVTKSQTAFAFASLYLVALGTGGIKPCVSSYGADQFDDADETERNHKGSFFNWFYFSINVGALVASSLIVWIQVHIGWGWGFGIPAAAMAIAVVSFFSGTRIYRYQKPGGSPLTRISQVVVASARKYQVPLPVDKSQLYESEDMKSAIVGCRKLDHTNGFSFFDKAAVRTQSDNSKVSPWRLCTVTQVEELKTILRLLPVWATGIVFSAVGSQMGNLFLAQATFMDTNMGPRFQIPAASLSIFDTLSVILWVPVYDKMIVPLARRFTGHKNGLSQLQRIGIGLCISILSMVYAAVLEIARLKVARRHNLYKKEDIVPISVFWQVPPYFIIGCAEVFTNIGSLEFFYEQAPDSMRSLCAALFLTTGALGSYLSSLLVLIVTKTTAKNGNPGWIPDNLNVGHLDYFFWLLSALSVVNLGAYIVVANMYTYKKAVGTLS